MPSYLDFKAFKLSPAVRYAISLAFHELVKASEAYKKQQIRLNEIATAIAKAKSETKKLQDEMDKLNPRGIDRVITANEKLGNKIKGTRKNNR